MAMARLMMFPTAPVVNLQTSDGKVVEVPLRIAKAFGTLRVMFDTLGEEDYGFNNRQQGPGEIIPLHNVDSEMLEIIVKWVTHHKDEISAIAEEASEVQSAESLEKISPWDRSFIDSFDISKLKRLIAATHYLDCEGLYPLCCKGLALRIQGKAPEEVRKLLCLPDDLTPEEQTQIKTENGVWEEVEKVVDDKIDKRRRRYHETTMEKVQRKKEEREREEAEKKKEEEEKKKEEEEKKKEEEIQGRKEGAETKKDEMDENKNEEEETAQKKEETEESAEEAAVEKKDEDREKETEEGNGEHNAENN